MSELQVTETRLALELALDRAIEATLDRSGTVRLLSPSSLLDLTVPQGDSLQEQIAAQQTMLRSNPDLALLLADAAPDLATEITQLATTDAPQLASASDSARLRRTSETLRVATAAASGRLIEVQAGQFEHVLRQMGADVSVQRTPTSAGVVARFADAEMVIGIGENGTTIDSAECGDGSCSTRTEELRRLLAERGLHIRTVRVTQHMDERGGAFARQVRNRARRHGDLARAAAEQMVVPASTSPAHEMDTTPVATPVSARDRGRS